MKKELCLIMSCFNGEKTITKTLESILIQDLDKSKYDIIIVDNGSSDETINIIEEFSEIENAKIILFKDNIGIYQDWNRAFALAKDYKYITNVHTDDILDYDHLSVMLDSIKDNDVCFARLKMSNGGMMEAPDGLTVKQQVQLNKMPIINIIKNDVWNELGGYRVNAKCYSYCDWDFGIRLLLANKKYCSESKPTYNYLVHEYNPPLPHYENCQKMWEEYREYLK
jgi:glycosyltransferase involved in cell wall biosynthesis